MRAGEGADLVLRGATVLDPVAGIDGRHDVVIRDGEIAELAAPGAADDDGLEEVDAEGLHAFPAFFDPHVHLRTPGQEHKEDIETGSPLGRGRWLLRHPRDGQHRAARLHAADVEALRERRPLRRLGPGRLPRHRHPRRWRARS